eukprot:358486-Chlamydomonas_euryale.AAC.23
MPRLSAHACMSAGCRRAAARIHHEGWQETRFFWMESTMTQRAGEQAGRPAPHRTACDLFITP